MWAIKDLSPSSTFAVSSVALCIHVCRSVLQQASLAALAAVSHWNAQYQCLRIPAFLIRSRFPTSI